MKDGEEMLFDEPKSLNEEIELENNEEVLTEEEFFELYNDSDDLVNYINEEFEYIEVEQEALLEAAMVDSYQLSEAPQQPQGMMGGIKREVNFQKNQMRKELNRKPVASNIFVRIFNVIKNAFGVVATFIEKAMTTFKINSLYSKISSLPDSMRFETLKGFLDNKIDSGLKVMQNSAQAATRFLNNIFIVGRMVERTQVQSVVDKFGEAAKSVSDGISKVLTTSKRGVLKQLDSLKRTFQNYSQIKLLYRSFLTIMNACSDPRKLANIADKIMKTTTGQGITGAGGVALDVLNKTVKKGNIMSNPVINFTVNNSCKIIGNLLSHYKKVVSENLRCITSAYQKAVNNPKNRGAIKNYQAQANNFRI